MCVFVATATGVAMAGSTAATTTTVMTAAQAAMQATYASMAMMANASLATTALSMGMNVYGQMQQSQAAQDQANYQAAVANNNKIIADRKAEDATKRGEIEERQHRLKVDQLKGKQRSALASSGFAVDQEDAIGILQDTAQLGEFDALTIRHNAEVEAYNHKVTGMNHQAQSGLYSAQANSQSPLLSGGSALFSGASAVADKWYRYQAG